MYRINQNRSMCNRMNHNTDIKGRMISIRNLNSNSCNVCEKQNSRNETDYVDGCGTFSNENFDYSLAFVYPSEQIWQNLYHEAEGFVNGTIFKELDKPFYGPKCHGGVCNE